MQRYLKYVLLCSALGAAYAGPDDDVEAIMAALDSAKKTRQKVFLPPSSNKAPDGSTGGTTSTSDNNSNSAAASNPGMTYPPVPNTSSSGQGNASAPNSPQKNDASPANMWGL